MPIPLDLMEDYKLNVYELTSAMIRRSMQLSVTGDEEMERDNAKVVSTAISQVLTKKVEYRIEE